MVAYVGFSNLPSAAPLPPADAKWPLSRVPKYMPRYREDIGKVNSGLAIGTGRPKNNPSRWHTAIDLITKAPGEPVFATESGTLVRFKPFYYFRTPFEVWALFLLCDSGYIINYGELHPDSLSRVDLNIGSTVKAGDHIGFTKKMKRDCMLHFEMYSSGLQSTWGRGTGNQKWKQGQSAPQYLLDPTNYLLELFNRKVNKDYKPKTETKTEVCK